MRDLRNPRRLSAIGMVAVPLLVLLLVVGLARSSQAAIAPSIDQHWELLSEQISDTVGTTHQIQRGVLPGANMQFSPAPTASFEVEAKVTGATNATWTLSLDDGQGGTALGSVAFTSSDSSPTLKVASFAWPALDAALGGLSSIKSATFGGPSVGGTFTVMKVYLKLHQAGLITSTVGRFPIGAKQTNITSTTWQDASDVIYYKHVTADFDPAPSVRLRMTGATSSRGDALWVRLVDAAGNVALSTGIQPLGLVGGVGNSQSAPSSLADGVYRLQVWFSPFTSTGVSADLYSADLVLTQSTSDPAGISKTVGWYASVTTPTSQTITNPGYMNFAFRAPTYNGFGQTVSWQGTSADGTNNTMTYSLCDQSNHGYCGYGPPPGGMGQSLAFSSVNFVSGDVCPNGCSLPDPFSSGDRLDTSQSGTGRITSSVLRVALQLRDLSGPSITGGNSTPGWISPNNDGKQDATTFTATLADQSFPVTWTMSIISGATGQAIRTFPQGVATAAGPISQTWDGTNDQFNVVPDGSYAAKLSATDAAGNTSTANVLSGVTVDDTFPVISGYGASPTIFRPVGGASTTFSATASEFLSFWKITVKNTAGATQYTATGDASTYPYQISAPWNGHNGNAIVPDGVYAADLQITDPAGNTSTGTTTVTVDDTAPTISPFAAVPNIFSPNGDPTNEQTTISASMSDASPPISWTLVIAPQSSPSNPVASYSGTGTSISQAWLGRNPSTGAAYADGIYNAVVTATDLPGNSNTPPPIPITIDNTPPVITSFTSSRTSFNPTSALPTLNAILTDASKPVTWSIAIANGSGPVRTLSGSCASVAACNAISTTWNGKDDGGNQVPDGTYSATFSATDGQNLTSSRPPVNITVDTVHPTVSGLSASFNPFSNNTASPKNPTLITATSSEATTWIVTGPCNGGLAQGGYNTSLNVSWNGKYSTGTPCNDGAYTITATATDPAGNQGSQSITVSIDSVAPAISSFAVDHPQIAPGGTGTFGSATLSANAADPSGPVSWTISIRNSLGIAVRVFNGQGSAVSAVWDGRDEGAIIVPDGTYSAQLQATDNAGNPAQSESIQVTVDDLIPDIHPMSVTPPVNGNTVFQTQRLMVRVTDSGSGVSWTTPVFVLRDLTQPLGDQTFAGIGLRTDTSTGWVATGVELPLQIGHRYQSTFSVLDAAGNPASLQWIFRSIAPTADSATASMVGSGRDTGEAGSLPGTERWSFSPTITLGNRSIHFPNGSEHPGLGALVSTVPIDSATVFITLSGQTQAWPLKPYPAGATRAIYQEFLYRDSAGRAEDHFVAPGSYDLQSFTMDLPSTTTAARVAMSDTSSSAIFGGTCRDPSMDSSGCTTDPERLFLSPPTVQQLNDNCPFPCVPGADEVIPLIMGLVPSTTDTDGGEYMLLQPLTADYCSFAVNSVPNCLVDSVLYQDGVPILYPPLYWRMCGQTVFCTQAATSANNANKYNCINSQLGTDLPPQCGWGGCSGGSDDHEAKMCQQYLSVHPPREERSYNGAYSGLIVHLFHERLGSDWGFNDRHGIGRDALGMHWSTRDQKMHYVLADPRDIDNGDPDMYLSYGVWSRDTDLYPQHSLSSDAMARRVYDYCFLDNHRDTSDVRTEFGESWDRDNKTIATGVGTASPDGNWGWRQWQSIGACGGGTQAGDVLKLRVNTADLYASVIQATIYGSVQHDGQLFATYGHERTDLPKSTWFFLINESIKEGCEAVAPACAKVSWAIQGPLDDDIKKNDYAGSHCVYTSDNDKGCWSYF